MKLVPVLTAEAVGPMVTGEVAASVIVEVADLVEEDSEDIRLPLNPSLTTTVKYIHNSQGYWQSVDHR